MIDTRFWSDGYIIDLDPSEKLLFIYLFTNSKTDICGAYEAPSKLIALETGIDKEMVEKMLKRFEADRKIIRAGSWVYIVNFRKHQRWNKSMEEGAKRSLGEVPHELAEKIEALASLGETAASLDTDCQIYKPKSIPEPESKPKPELEPKGGVAISSPTPKQDAQKFFADASKQIEVADILASKGVPAEMAKREVAKFVGYWTEPSHNGKKQRWELQKTFEVRRRLVTWMQRAGQRFSVNSSQPKTIKI